jgi:malonyl-CoA O-methyltransferase
MEVTAKARILRNMTSECLRLMRAASGLPAPEADETLAGLDLMLEDWKSALAAAGERDPLPELSGSAGYSLWAPTYDGDPSNMVILSEEQRIWDLIGDMAGRAVLDVGCGTGRHAIRLAQGGASVTGCEPNATLREMARAKAAGLSIQWLNHDIAALPADLGEFDLVLCCLVLSHVEDIGEAVGKLARFVRKGGALIVSDFHPFNLMIGWRTSFHHDGKKYVVPNSIHLPSEYFGTMRSAGLRVDAFEEAGGFPSLPGQPAVILMKAVRP